MNIAGYILLGLTAGIVGGAFGVGGGVIMVPAMVMLLGMTQHQAQGTTLAVMLPPIFFLAVWQYYRAGYVNVPIAVYVGLGFFFGAFLGASMVQGLPDVPLKRAFGILIMIVGLKMAFFK